MKDKIKFNNFVLLFRKLVPLKYCENSIGNKNPLIKLRRNYVINGFSIFDCDFCNIMAISDIASIYKKDLQSKITSSIKEKKCLNMLVSNVERQIEVFDECKNDYNYKIYGGECEIEHAKERKKNMNIPSVSFMFNNLLGFVSDASTNVVTSCIKNKLGSEFYLVYEWGNYKNINDINKKFTIKCENHLHLKNSFHTINFDNNEIEYHDVSFIAPIDKLTFAFFAFGNKIPNQVASKTDNTYGYYNDMYIFICGRNKDKYTKYINRIIKNNHVNSYNGFGIYNVTANSDKDDNLLISYSQLPVRNDETMFYSLNEMKILERHIDIFNDRKDFYKARQLNYKTGILLYGEPGTGKSTIVKVLANKYRRSIIQIDMSNIDKIDLNMISESINVDNNEYIVLLEDIDTIYLSREKETDNNAVINKLLQFLDSNTSPNNVIFIATTNHLDRLDEALIREGRFDLKLKISCINRNDSIRFGKSFGLKQEQIDEVLMSINNKNDQYNQSKLQALFIDIM